MFDKITYRDREEAWGQHRECCEFSLTRKSKRAENIYSLGKLRVKKPTEVY